MIEVQTKQIKKFKQNKKNYYADSTTKITKAISEES